MAREIVIWCDRHLNREEPERVTGTARRLSLGGRETELDLCEPCWTELAEPLASLLEVAGQPVSRRRSRRKAEASSSSSSEEPAALEHDCTEPGCGRSFTSAQGLSMHRRRAHSGESW